MDLVIANTRKLKMEFLRFYKSQYIDNPLARDGMSGLLKNILFEKSVMSKSIDIIPLLAVEDRKIYCVCVLAHAKRMPDIIQISFFESSEYNKEAFSLLYKQALEMAKEYHATKISASLNIHVNYGLGFLADKYEEMQSFGMPYNKEFVHKYFEDYDFDEIDLVTFKKNTEDMDSPISPFIKKRLAKTYTVRELDIKNLKAESMLYSELNNNAFSDHVFYYKRDPDEDLELFKNFKPLLKPENLLFVEKEGKAVGFMLWYPDFNELTKPGETVGFKTFIRYKLLNRKIDKFKIVEIGVIKAEQGLGGILALFDYCYGKTNNKFKSFESSWILDNNIKSRGFGDKWSDGIAKTYKAYIKDIKDEY
ncbi:MAG: hypothetical protein RBR71_06105 [Gudongella sp.]|nr:hypothetical protein [Gudongella sp.]